MERIRDLQREHHKRSLAHLLHQSLQQNAQPQPPTNGGLASPTKSGKSQNLYDTVADALEQDGPPPPATPPYHRPFDEIGAAAAAATSSANLDSQRHEIDSWLLSMEKRFGDFVQEYNQAYLQRRKSSLTRNGPVSNTSLESLTSEASLKKQLTIISNYQSELNQYSAKLSNLSNSVDGRIASLVPNGSDVIKSNISMPYYDHLVELRKHADEMQIRINDLYLSIKCKLRSLQELFHYSTNSGSATNSASSRINLMSSGLVNGAGLDLGIDFHNTSSSASLKSKSSKQTQNASVQNAAIAAAARIAAASSSGSGGSGGDSGSGSTSSQVTAVAGSLTPTGYSLHEQSEKRFSKWLAEIEQSLQYIEKRLEAESALNQSGGKTEDGDDPLYSNVSEMQQMHMNYFEKIKIMQREIEQKRTDHRILMELLESESESDQTGSVQSGQSRGSQRDGSMGKRVIDPWLARFRSRVETLNTRWNSVRLRVLTVRSRLESNSIYATAMTTTVPQTPSSASLYSMNGYGTTTAVPPSRPPSSAAIMDETASSIAVTVAFNSAATERASQLLLSLRELVEWIIKRQTEYEAQQQTQQQAQLQAQATSQPNVPLDIANVLNQKSSLIQLRSQLGDKRPIIDSSLLACHNLLRRLAIKRSQDVQQSRLPSSVSMASSIAGSVATGVTGEYDPVRIEKIRAAKRQELAELEVTVSREMQRLLEIWNTLQVDVEMRLQRLDDAHLRLTDLQRAMEDLGAKLHEAEYTKAQWMPLGEIPYDQIPQQKALLKNYSQLYVTPIARDAVHVNELASRLTGRNVPLSHANLKSLEEATTRARLLQVAVDERARELEQAVHDHGTAQQHFLTEAVEAPWERAVTSNKLPCYINRTTESVHVVSPKYTEIMSTLSDFNRVRYAAYRTAMKLRSLQAKLGLDFVTLDILAEAFEQHGLGPNGVPKTKERQAQSNGGSGKGDQHPETSATTSANLAEDINEDLPYELRLIAVPEIVSCLKMIFEMVAATAAVDSANSGSVDQGTSKRKKDKDKENKDKESSVASGSSTTAASVNVPLSVDLCLNWVLALYDAPSRSGYIRQFSFQVALVLLSKISLEQKYLYLFNLIADDNGRADERRLGLLIYDCLRLPKLLGEVAAFGGTNIEPSVRSCLEMAGKPPEGITAQQVLTWIQAEPQSLVWLLVLHRLRLADKSRHPAKCNLCRRYPIVGFRYRCLKCFNFDLCQECFLCDLASKKHKSSHPMQEYCVATTSGEDMRDFTRILRNKFKSGRYFKRHQALGYLPVQSLHEGDRIEESAPQFVHTLQGSYSHNPSSNTTPVHTLPYPARAASPGALTQRDLEFVLDNAGSRFQATVDRSMSSSSSMYGRTGPLGARRQTSVEHHYQSSPYSPIVQPKHSMQHASPFDRRLPQYHSTPVSPIHHNRSMDDEVHTRLGHYASRLAEAELVRAESLNRGSSTAPHRSLSQRSRQSRFDSLPGGGPNIAGSMGNGGPRHARTLPMNDAQLNHYDLVQSPTEMLSKIAADQRSELEQIIQRLEEENKMLVTEFDQLNDDDQPTGKTESKKEVSKKEPIAKLVDANLESEAVGEFSPLYENVIHSLERRQRERQEKEGKRPADPSSPVNGSNSRGDSLDSLDDSPASAATTATASMSNSGPIPAHLLEEARRLRENKSRLETRKTELEQCNQLLETQLTQFKAYISNSGALDAKTKKRLAKSIIEMEQMLDSSSTSSPGSPRTATTNGSNSPLRKQTGTNGVLESNKDSSLDSPASSSISQYHPSLLHNAADRVNNAVDNLVEAFTEGESGLNSPPAPQPTNGH